MLGLKVDDIENINTRHAKSTISAWKSYRNVQNGLTSSRLVTEISYGYLMHKMTRTIPKTVILGV